MQFRNEDERTQWLDAYERDLATGMEPHIAARRADDDMAIRRRVWPTVEEIDYPELLEVALSAVTFKRNMLRSRGEDTSEIDGLLNRMKRAAQADPTG